MRKFGLLISLCVIFSISIVVFLHETSNNFLHVKNDFIRFFPSHPLEYIGELDIKPDSYYISGTSTDHIYLGDYTAPEQLLVIDYQLSDTTLLLLRITDTLRTGITGIQAYIDYPNVYMKETVTPAIYYGDLSKSDKITKHPINNFFDHFYFSMAVPISPSSFVLRTYDNAIQQDILTKISTDSSLKHASYILEKQIDGIFCTDGMLHYDPDSNLLVYVYFYRNEFICMDTELNIIHKGKTIDTISQARIKIASYSSGRTTTLSTPPLFVNNKSCIENDRLYINSALMAKNEDEENFKNNSVIDVYSLKDGRYIFSFYLPKYNGQKIRDLFVTDNKLVILYKNHITTCILNH